MSFLPLFIDNEGLSQRLLSRTPDLTSPVRETGADGIRTRVIRSLGKRSTTELHPRPCPPILSPSLFCHSLTHGCSITSGIVQPVCVSVSLSVFIPFRRHLSLSPLAAPSQSACPFCLSVCLSFCLSVHLSVCLSVCLSIRLSVSLLLFFDDKWKEKALLTTFLTLVNTYSF